MSDLSNRILIPGFDIGSRGLQHVAFAAKLTVPSIVTNNRKYKGATLMDRIMKRLHYRVGLPGWKMAARDMANEIMKQARISHRF